MESVVDSQDFVAVDVTGRLDRVVDELVGVDPSELSELALAESLLALRAATDRQEAVFARLAQAGHVRGDPTAPS